MERCNVCFGRRWVLSTRSDNGRTEIQRCDMCSSERSENPIDDCQAGELALAWFSNLRDCLSNVLDQPNSNGADEVQCRLCLGSAPGHGSFCEYGLYKRIDHDEICHQLFGPDLPDAHYKIVEQPRR